MTRSKTKNPESGPSWLAVVDGVVLALVLAVLALRVTITEAPAVRTSSLVMNRYDQVYSLAISWILILCAAWGAWSRWAVRRPKGMVWGLAIFLAAALAGCFIASDRRLAINQVVVSVAPMGLAVFLSGMLDQAWKRHLVLALIAALAVAGSFQCLNQGLYSNAAMIAQYQTDPNSLLDPLGIEPGTLQEFLFEHRLLTGGAPGFFTTRNSAGSFALLALFATLALFLDKRSGQRESSQRMKAIALYAATAGFILLGLILAKSKGAMVGLVLAGSILAALVRWRRWIGTYKTLVCIFALALMTLLTGVLVHYGLRHDKLPGGSSMLVRWQYWHATGRMIADHPWLGVGPGNFSVYYDHYKPTEALESVADPHNFILSLLAQYGPLGLIGLLLLVWTPLRRAFSIDSSETTSIATSEPAPRWALGISAAAVAVAVFALSPWVSTMLNAGDPWSSPFTVLLAYGIPGVLILVGFLLLSEGPKGWDRDHDPLPGPSYATLFLAGGIVAVLVANLIDFALFEPAIATCFWAMVGCLIASSKDRETSPMPPPCLPSRSVRHRWDTVLGLSVVGVGCCVWTIGPVLESSRRIEQAGQATAAGDFDLAHRLMDQAAEADRLSATAPGIHGKLYLQQYLRYGPKDPSLLDKAVECFVTATQRNPADFRDYERLGDAYDLLGRPERAYPAMHEAALRYPGCDRLWFRLGQIAETWGRPQLAATHYAKAIEIEEAFRRQFAALYPDWKKSVSRLGEENYQFARQRLQALTGKEPPQ